MASKRHHFVPEAYLKRFADTAGRLYGYRKDEPRKPLYQVPRELGHERYYYAQSMPDGTKDTDRLEQLFSTVESAWDVIAERALARQDINDDLESLMTFLVLMRVRGPAMRDAVELNMAETVRLTLEHMEAKGELPSLEAIPEHLRHLLKPENLQIAIDPHRSLWAMPQVMEGVALVLDRLGYRLIHNDTPIDFITSDNPVVYFDPRAKAGSMLPYTVIPGHPIELIFPISPRLVLVGHTDFYDRFTNDGVIHAVLQKPQTVKRANRLIARFGYRFVFARTRDHEPLIEKYAHESPVPLFRSGAQGTGRFLATQMVFGSRPPKPKWREN